jgi:ribosomal protein L40E
MKLTCMECGRTTTRRNPTADTRCRNCGGYDLEPAEIVLTVKRMDGLTVRRGKEG